MASPYKTHWYDRRPSRWFSKSIDRPLGATRVPECIRIAPDRDAPPSDRAPVRIFLGTEPGQYRATRVFVWSVMQVRDPGRAYEIHLMSDLAGIDRVGWKTGFTNYRYAIPALAGNSGRAIYNDVDQIYLSDPARLFDTEMDGKGVLAISQAENSVMLIDCAVMGPLWTLDDVAAGKGHAHFKGVVSANGLFGAMPGSWNARDGEYPVEATDCLHYTTLHTQPWKPFPDELRYRPSPLAEVWHALERSADCEGFLLFTADRPTRQFETSAGRADASAASDLSAGEHLRDADRIASLVAGTGARTILYHGPGLYDGPGAGDPAAPAEQESSPWRVHPAWGGVRVRHCHPGAAITGLAEGERFDGVISMGLEAGLSPWDVPWVLDRIFALADRFVYVVVAGRPSADVAPGGRKPPTIHQPPHWWRMMMEMAARRRPEIRWQLACEDKGMLGRRRSVIDGSSPSVVA